MPAFFFQGHNGFTFSIAPSNRNALRCGRSVRRLRCMVNLAQGSEYAPTGFLAQIRGILVAGLMLDSVPRPPCIPRLSITYRDSRRKWRAISFGTKREPAIGRQHGCHVRGIGGVHAVVKMPCCGRGDVEAIGVLRLRKMTRFANHLASLRMTFLKSWNGLLENLEQHS